MFVKWVNGWSFKVTVGAFCCDADTMQSDAKQRCPRPDMIHRQYANSHPAAPPRPSHPTIPHATLRINWSDHCCSIFNDTARVLFTQLFCCRSAFLVWLHSWLLTVLLAELCSHGWVGSMVSALAATGENQPGVFLYSYFYKGVNRFWSPVGSLYTCTGYHASHT